LHGIVFPNPGQDQSVRSRGVLRRIYDVIWSNRFFFAIVVLPSLLVGLYYAVFAADQYESSANFIVRKAESGNSGPELGQVLGFSLGTSATASDAYVVQAYLLSHDAVSRLSASNDLVGVFRRPEADLISRLWHTDPERLLKFYRKQVTVSEDETTGLTTLTVHTFRPNDSYAVAQKLLQMGEEQINQINKRTYTDQVSNAQHQMDEAEHQLADVQTRLTTYRRGHEDLNPADTGKAEVTLVTDLTGSLVAARAKLHAMDGAISPASPQYQAMARQVAALESQVASQSSKIAGTDHSIATRLSDYEQLQIKREEVAKVYAAAAVQFEQAKAEARRKQLYLIRVVEPNRAVRSEFPKRGQIVLTVFVALFFAYGIGWLLWTGFKEHSM
jgi:capsular polysaccharide transport system permease protein